MKNKLPSYLLFAILFAVAVLVLSVAVQCYAPPEAHAEESPVYKNEDVEKVIDMKYRTPYEEKSFLYEHSYRDYKIKRRDGWTQSMKMEFNS